MKKFISGPKFKILICIVVLLAGGMAYAGITGQLTTLPGDIATAVVTPFQRFGSWVSQGVGDIIDRFSRYGEAQEENARLRQQIVELEQQLVEFEQYKSENEQLREFYDIRQDNHDWEGRPCFVVGRDPLAQFYSFTIDGGSLAGIGPGDPVVSSGGSLVGIVVDVGPSSSRVKTLLDPSVSAAVMVSRTRDNGLVEGDATLADEGTFLMTGLSRDSTATLGDRVVTTGLGGAYPGGLLVGTVEDIVPDSAGSSLKAIIRPTDDLRNLSSVMVITSF